MNPLVDICVIFVIRIIEEYRWATFDVRGYDGSGKMTMLAMDEHLASLDMSGKIDSAKRIGEIVIKTVVGNDAPCNFAKPLPKTASVSNPKCDGVGSFQNPDVLIAANANIDGKNVLEGNSTFGLSVEVGKETNSVTGWFNFSSPERLMGTKLSVSIPSIVGSMYRLSANFKFDSLKKDWVKGAGDVAVSENNNNGRGWQDWGSGKLNGSLALDLQPARQKKILFLEFSPITDLRCCSAFLVLNVPSFRSALDD